MLEILLIVGFPLLLPPIILSLYNKRYSPLRNKGLLTKKYKNTLWLCATAILPVVALSENNPANFIIAPILLIMCCMVINAAAYIINSRLASAIVAIVYYIAAMKAAFLFGSVIYNYLYGPVFQGPIF